MSRCVLLPYGPVRGATVLSGDLLDGKQLALPSPISLNCDVSQLVQAASQVEAVRPRQEVADATLAYQRKIGAPEVACDAAALLADPNTFVVATGQGPGFLGGPALSMYKAMACVQICTRLRETDPGRNWVPVFWNASQGQNAAEMERTALFEGGSLRKLSAGLPRSRQPLANLTVTDKVLAERDKFLALLPGEAARARAADLLAGEAGISWSLWFSQIMTRLLGAHGLVVIEPQIWQTQAAPLLNDALAQGRSLWEALQEQNRAIEAAGYPLAVAEQEGSFVFADTEEGRKRLPEGAALKGSGSPDVLLRPVLQSALLPVVAQVSGPSEIAYMAQSAALFAKLKVPPPVCVPRMSLTLLDERTTSLFDRFGLSLETCTEEGADATALLLAHLPQELQADLDASQDAFAGIDPLEARAVSLEPGLASTFARVRERVARDVAKLRARTAEAALRKEGLDPGQLRFLMRMLRPDGMAQERILNYVALWASQPGDLTEILLAQADALASQHQVLFLEAGGNG